ncbi:hypothetical protein [Nocardia asiatica]
MLDTPKAFVTAIWNVSDIFDRIFLVGLLVFAGVCFAHHEINWGITNLIFIGWLITVLVWQAIAAEWKRRYEELAASVSASWQPAQNITINVSDVSEGLRKAQQIANTYKKSHGQR